MTTTTYEIWYSETGKMGCHLWGIYTDKERAEWEMLNAKGQGYNPTMWTFEK